MIKNINNKIIILDKITYASNISSMKNIIKYNNVVFVKGFIQNKFLVKKFLKEYNPNYVVNFEAETHVDSSIKKS
jgi:dTDP-glucose 4,6-dehydratase